MASRSVCEDGCPFQILVTAVPTPQPGLGSMALTSLSVSNETNTRHESLPIYFAEADHVFPSATSRSGALDELMLLSSVLTTLGRAKPHKYSHQISANNDCRQSLIL